MSQKGVSLVQQSLCSMSYLIDRDDEPEKSLVDDGKVSAEGIASSSQFNPQHWSPRSGRLPRNDYLQSGLYMYITTVSNHKRTGGRREERDLGRWLERRTTSAIDVSIPLTSHYSLVIAKQKGGTQRSFHVL